MRPRRRARLPRHGGWGQGGDSGGLRNGQEVAEQTHEGDTHQIAGV